MKRNADFLSLMLALGMVHAIAEGDATGGGTTQPPTTPTPPTTPPAPTTPTTPAAPTTPPANTDGEDTSGKRRVDMSDEEYAEWRSAQLKGRENGDLIKQLVKVETDNKALRESALKRGQVAIPQADADALTGYRALGTVEELQALRAENATLKAGAAERDRDGVLEAVAAKTGANKATLKRVSGGAEFKFEGDAVTVTYEHGGKKVSTPYDQYVKDVLPDMAEILLPKGKKVFTGGANTPAPKTGTGSPAAVAGATKYRRPGVKE